MSSEGKDHSLSFEVAEADAVKMFSKFINEGMIAGESHALFLCIQKILSKGNLHDFKECFDGHKDLEDAYEVQASIGKEALYDWLYSCNCILMQMDRKDSKEEAILPIGCASGDTIGPGVQSTQDAVHDSYFGPDGFKIDAIDNNVLGSIASIVMTTHDALKEELVSKTDLNSAVSALRSDLKSIKRVLEEIRDISKKKAESESSALMPDRSISISHQIPLGGTQQYIVPQPTASLLPHQQIVSPSSSVGQSSRVARSPGGIFQNKPWSSTNK